ncbi:DUF3090 domain-containing protein [Phycicoccus sp. CSK15P-2]|uniref:DUF3090 domain-containing protein n=1 Tax=Phycicoccus sp. CSK15P-2 TaxID=2807627 RepID=UPI00195019B4|nr:DUF3090 domain-containing protein [Phycicoccus sp. CSK15P-2]MBM6405830.1 DUF3090 domain-containing protein [Phycicoccus sp. CSK15P-2]
MPSTVFDPPERFVAGTVGPPGGRTFFLQARGEGRVVSVSIEKVQVSVLAERVDDMLDTHAEGTATEPYGEGDNEPLDTPIDDDFRVDTLSLAWDPERLVVVIECHDQDPEEVGEGALQTLRVVLTPEAARAFARRCGKVVAAGRPSCPFCGQPLDPTGHICPRANGYRR